MNSFALYISNFDTTVIFASVKSLECFVSVIALASFCEAVFYDGRVANLCD
ncbi:protein of unknown function [Xenorhabdus poinarii G6]|uniref:Uncharacterized protein n=1 Tax=Xenorhabdus poinarii G6 TaxID=1354304 RepID=A0A068QZF2_9GAMM|nr:protein of unknown function [Xenorhabdus poinarii G6]